MQTKTNMKKNINTFLGFNNKYKNSKAVLFGVPFDSTTSFKNGARFAPSAMREDSWGLETYSPYQDKDLDDIKLFDGGDLELPFGNTKKCLNTIENFYKKITGDDKIPIMIGGEHLVSLPAIRSLIQKYNDLHIIHFDAHTDLRNKYMGEKLSHATVMRRIYELVKDGKIFQFGIRSGTKKEFVWAKDKLYMEQFSTETLDTIIDKIQDKPIYITIDLDVINPCEFGGTGTPEAGGISCDQLINNIKSISRLKNVVGVDLVELAPKIDQSGVSTATACKVLRELVLAVV